MPTFVNNSVTNNGAIAIASALAGVQLVITRVAIGSGIATGNIATLTNLVGFKMNLTPTPPQVSANNVQPGEVIVLATMDSINIPGSPFSWTELGVFGKSGGGTEVLICYSQCSSPYDTLTHATGGSRLQVTVDVPIVVGVGSSTGITVVAGNPVYVPPVVAGTGIVVQAPTDSSGRVIEWIVSTPQISNDTTLQVFAGANNVNPNFSTIQNAITYLQGFTIASGKQVLINVHAGYYSGQVYLDHLNASQIVITGPQNPDVGFTGFGTITGSAGNWRIPLLGCTSTAGMYVGMFIIVWNTGGGTANEAPMLAQGFMLVEAISGSTVTILGLYGGATYPSMAGATGGAFTPITAYLNPPGNTWAFITGTHGIGTLQYIGTYPTATPTTNQLAWGFLIQGPATLNHLGAWGYLNNTQLCTGIESSGGNAVVYASFCGCTNNNNGFVSGNSTLSLVWCSASYNKGIAGFWIEGGLGGVVTSTGSTLSTFCGNTNGIYVSDGSEFAITASYYNGAEVDSNAYCMFNDTYAVIVANRSLVVVSNNNCHVLVGSSFGPYDIAISGGLSMCAANAIGQPGPVRYSQTLGVLTPQGLITS